VPISPSGVEYEYAPGMSEEWTSTGQALTLTLSCAWTDRFLLKQDLLGYARINSGTQQLERVLPMPHPESSELWATGVRLAEPKGVLQRQGDVPLYLYWEDGTLLRDGKAWLSVTYQSTLYDVEADDDIEGEWERFTIRRLKGSVEAQRTPGNGWRWVGSTPEKLLRADLSLPYQITTVEWHWLALPALPPNMHAATNRVNSTAFEEFAAETLLFGPPYQEPVQLPNLTRGWNITYSACHRPNGWNKFWKPTDPVGTAGPGFYAVEAKDADSMGNRRKPFLTQEFRTCWSFAPLSDFVGGF
jgi:hypothetical protein